MSGVIEEKFACLTEEEVWAQIAGDNEVSREVRRLMAHFWNLYLDCVNSYGNIPPQVMYVSVRHPIEHVAVTILTDPGKADLKTEL